MSLPGSKTCKWMVCDVTNGQLVTNQIRALAEAAEELCTGSTVEVSLLTD